MWYINLHPVNTNYGNPTSSPAPDSLALPDELLSVYIDTRGFANIQHQDGVVTAVSVNRPALDAYMAEHPDVVAEQERKPSAEERLDKIEQSVNKILGILKIGGKR